MLSADVSDERQLSLALEIALGTFEGRSRGQTFGQFLVEMLRAVVIVENSGVGEDLAADLTVVGLVFVELPAFSEFLLHQAEDDSMRQSEVATQIRDVSADESAFRTFVRFSARKMFHHFFTEVAEKVDALVAGLVHACLELLAAKFTTKKRKLIKLFYSDIKFQ